MKAKALKILPVSILLLLLIILITHRGVIAQKETGPSPLGMLTYRKNGDWWVKELPNGQAQQFAPEGHGVRPIWSPSGQWAAFLKDGELWIARPFGSNARVLSSGAKTDTLAWAPSSEWIAYRKNGELRVVRPSGADARALSPGMKVETLAWAPVAATLAYVTRTGSLHLASAAEWREREVVAAADGQELRRSFFSMAWSPDGQWLAYVREEMMKKKEPPDNRYASLWRIHANGSDATELSNTASTAGGLMVAGWSPDSQYILFWPVPLFSSSLLADGTSLMAIPATGGKPVKLVESMLAYNDFLAWSPDGKLLAVTAGVGRETWSHKRIAVVEPTSGTLTYLTDDKTAALSPLWSPDARRIAYVAAPDIGFVGGGEEAKTGAAKRRIWVMKRDGSEKHPLTYDAAYRDEQPRWLIDGSHILFFRLDQNGRSSLWLMREDGSEVQQLTDLSPASDWFGYYGHVDWSGDFAWWRGVPRQP